MFKFFPHTEEEVREMLKVAGVNSLEELYADVPESIRFNGEYDIPEAKSELEVRQLLEHFGLLNDQLISFAGAGVYDHYIPAAVPNIISRSEFLTSYTPYQAEISQGTLHYIFEFQSMMAELTGMEISNASMYDGSTATAEAAAMAMVSGKKCTKVLASRTIDPKTLRVVETYAKYQGFDIELIDEKDGVTDREDMRRRLNEGGVAGVILQAPNYYGIVEDYTGFADDIHEKKALMIMNSVAADLAVLRTPGEWGADIAVGDGQSLGIPMSFGGAYVGYLCCSEKLIRKMPGRIVGMTHDSNGKRAFVLTLQAREQHIRRQKATSNICSNQSLMALNATIYMSLMGKEGLKEAAELSYAGAHYLCDELVKTGHFKPAYNQPFFNEFCVKYDGDVDALQNRCIAAGYLAGVKIDDHTLMLAVTEKRQKNEIDELVELMKEDVK
ncbi:MAG: aminomethyl-transferring glycine dehydrogenase subunit GcvPA [Prevotella sp.]|uniref:aminomethyl-transferring glycine dehydrogenase subunit GcvPA n=1 Tax=Prevotella sp. TaxID=59823 RepID=UPI002A3403C8|nr:aminomethyl-transferring glycine dehydrogenase subunit GcvPA [Prevotella sp.]MDD7318284.1 aminomethyl-transferring glycine dehydrogenase subunit GcvPA [Prevotellaceae bacterium]MDY4019712.1 aminomethyl-transferring glycine dehydrogenase subunit GcvPA [Prevotella sp.]